MKKLVLFLLFLITMFCGGAQTQYLIESQYKNLATLEKQLTQAKSATQKTDTLISLYLYHSLHNEPQNIKAAIHYRDQLEIFTHQENDPELTARSLFFQIRPALGEEKKERIDRLYEYAKLNNLDFWKAQAIAHNGVYHFSTQDGNKALALVNESVNISKGLNDSLRATILTDASLKLTGMNAPLPALALAFQGHDLAVKLKNRNLTLLSNNAISSVYRTLKNYPKAIAIGIKELQEMKLHGPAHFYARKHAIVATDFFMSNQLVLGNYHVQEAFRLADSLKGSKRLYNEISGNIITSLARSDNNETLAAFVKDYRQHFFIFPGSEFTDNVTLAVCFAKINRMDSARIYIKRATEYLHTVTPGNLRVYYYTLARLAAFDKKWNEAGEYWKKTLGLGLAQNNLNFSINYIDSLKFVLTQQNLFQEAFYYYKLGDSVKAELAKQSDNEEITRQEVAALEKEKEYNALVAEKEKNQRHNVQYLGITFGVVALFISLLLMGMFKVSPRTIKILSFFSFLLFFEFIFLIFKKQIAVFTHGEPWKDLAFMVLLAALMVPLHHWSETKVVEYLSTKRISFRRSRVSAPKIVQQDKVH